MVISRVIIRVTPFRALITLLITYLLSPLPLQAEGLTEEDSRGFKDRGKIAATMPDSEHP